MIDDRELANNESVSAIRAHYIDWLRLITVLTVFFFHVGRVFDPEFWYIKNSQLSPTLTLFVFFAHQWIMPLLFMLAGAGTYLSLKRRKTLQYLTERGKRLLIPYLFGLILLAPPQAYLQGLSRGEVSGSFWAYYPQFFANLTFPSDFSWLGHGCHLWFLGFLFFYSLPAIPLFSLLNSKIGKIFKNRLAAWSEKRGVIFLAFLPLAFIQGTASQLYPGYLDWGNFFFWLMFFLFGLVLISEDRFLRAVADQFELALILAGGSMLLMFAAHTGQLSWPALLGSVPGYIVTQLLRGLNNWSLIIFFLALAMRYINKRHVILSYANEAVLPFYIIHQTVIVIAAFYAVQMETGVFIKYLIIGGLSLVATISSYELLVRRFTPARFLFGMKSKNPGKQDEYNNLSQ